MEDKIRKLEESQDKIANLRDELLVARTGHERELRALSFENERLHAENKTMRSDILSF